MTDKEFAERMTEQAYYAYVAYTSQFPNKEIDFNSFAVGWLIGAIQGSKNS